MTIPSDRPAHPDAVSAAATEAHLRAMETGADGYVDPDTGFWVFTQEFLASRASCCGSGCRHCPY